MDNATPPDDSPDTEPVRGIGEISYIHTTLPAIELLAKVFAAVADAAESLYSTLVLQHILDRPNYKVGRTAARDIGRAVSPISARPDSRRRWNDRGRA